MKQVYQVLILLAPGLSFLRLNFYAFMNCNLLRNIEMKLK